jgi:hypothetical protein
MPVDRDPLRAGDRLPGEHHDDVRHVHGGRRSVRVDREPLHADDRLSGQRGDDLGHVHSG